MPADAGRPPRLFSVAFGPARLHFPLNSNMSTSKPPTSMLRYVLSLGIVAIWGLGVASAVIGGNNPGYVRRDIPHPYPTGGVLFVCAIISVEAIALYAILRPRSFVARPSRAIVALAVFVPLAVAEYLFLSGWTDQAGHCYANGFFLRSALIYLVIAAVAGQIMRMGARHEF